MPPRHWVYILRSERDPRRYYTGLTSNVIERLKAHNEALSTHTATACPWTLVAQFWFADPQKAAAFEIYLESGSGRAFASQHLR